MTLSQYRGERALVLGATGFIGTWLARALADAGAELHLASRSPHQAFSQARRYSIDPFAAGAMDTLLARVRPRFVFNAIGFGVDPEERDDALAWRVNAALPRMIGEACRAYAGAAPLTLVHVGSMAEVGPSAEGFAEDHPCEPTSTYGRTKLAGSAAVAEACATGELRGGVGRLFMVYGPGEHPGRLLPSLFETATSRRPLDLSPGLQERDFTYVSEAAEGLLRLGLLGLRGETVNVATGIVHSVREFSETAADVLGFPRHLLRFGVRSMNPHDGVQGSVKIERLKRLTGWAPRIGISEGIAETARILAATGDGAK